MVGNPNFPADPEKAIVEGFAQAEEKFIRLSIAMESDRSGSCAIMALLLDNLCMVANVGDCRAVISAKGGKQAIAMSRDHKPNDPAERQRIVSRGGIVYQQYCRHSSIMRE